MTGEDRPALRASSAFSTGNGRLTLGTDGALLDRELRGSAGDRWYWHLRVTAKRSTELQITLARPRIMGRFGPAVRADNTYDWLWSCPGPESTFTLQLPAGTTVHASATIPYGWRELHTFSRALRGKLRWEKLTTSEAGRKVPYFRVPNADARRLIVVTARHHACEAMASFVVEGVVEQFIELLGQADPVASRCELIVVPLMDLDGVESGDQGKGRPPWDHNRDYGPRNRYRAVAAFRALMATERRPVYALDLHTPGLRGDIEERPYVVMSAEDGDVAQYLLTRLNELDFDVPLGDSYLLRFDEDWNSSTGTGQLCCAAWLRSLPMTRVAATIEYPNAVDRGLPVTPARARTFGAALIRSLLCLTA